MQDNYSYGSVHIHLDTFTHVKLGNFTGTVEYVRKLETFLNLVIIIFSCQKELLSRKGKSYSKKTGLDI